MSIIKSIFTGKSYSANGHSDIPSDNPDHWLNNLDISQNEKREIEIILSKGYDHRTLAVALKRNIPIKNFIEWVDPEFSMFQKERSPRQIHDYQSATDHLCDWICSGHPIALVGDYDVDGATSVAILGHTLKALGYEEGPDIQADIAITGTHSFHVKIPERSEGYGFTPAIARTIASMGIKHIVVLDSGTTASAAILEALSVGSSLIIVDHHQPTHNWSKPSCSPHQSFDVLNPLIRPEAHQNLYNNCCTAGLAYLWMWNVRSEMGRRHKAGNGPDGQKIVMDDLSILASVGTVADIMVLTSVNRMLVLDGMNAIRGLPGIALIFAAYDRLDENDVTDEQDIGFTLAPLINASGRLEGTPGASSRNGSEMFLLNNLSPEEEERYFKQACLMRDLNETRKETQNIATLEAMKEVSESPALQASPVLVYQGDIPEGVIGLVASRLLEIYNRPTIVFSASGKGSGRSIKGFNLGLAFHKAVDLGILAAGGGHEMAAGATLAEGKIDEFRQFMAQEAASFTAPQTPVDFDADFSDVSPSFIRALEGLKPFGNGNPIPLFLVRNVHVTETTLSKSEKILNVFIEDKDHEIRAKAAVMLPKGTPIGEFFMNPSNYEKKTINLIAEISIDNRFRKGELQIFIKDVV